MSKILLDYVFPISVITPTPAASTAFLKNVCVVAKPKSGQEGLIGTITLCTSMTSVAALTDNTNAQQLFNAGMNRVYILLSTEVDLSSVFLNASQDFYTVLISDDFTDADIEPTQASGSITVTSYANLTTAGDDTISINGVVFTAKASGATGDNQFNAATSNTVARDNLLAKINAHPSLEGIVTATSLSTAGITITADEVGVEGNAITLAYADNGTATIGATVSGAVLTGGDGIDMGAFNGVVGVSSTDLEFCEAQAIIENRCVFFTNNTNKAKNMFYAFGKLLSNLINWNDQQYITMPVNDDVDELGEATNLFDNRISFVLHDSEFNDRLSLFCAGQKAISAPYILKNLQVDLQSKALQWISGNQPKYTLTEAALLETRLQEDVMNLYIETHKWITDGVVEITLVQDNFVANGAINVAEPKALWRVFNEMRQTL